MTTETEWIPINEGLPKEVVRGTQYKDEHSSNVVLVTIKASTGKRIATARYSYSDNEWKVQNDWTKKSKVLAWMPLPEPYDKKRKCEENCNDVIKSEVAEQNAEKVKQITQLIEDYVDVSADYETVKYNLGHESFFQLASDMTDVLSTIKKIAEVL